MKRLRQLACCTFVVIPLAAGCNKASTTGATTLGSDSQASLSAVPEAAMPQSDREAISQAIQAHLRDNKGINMSVMDMNVGKVNVKGDQAQADTEFHLKQGGTSMLITYFLERHGNGWLVVRNQPSNAGQFAHPPMDKIHSGAAPPLKDLPDFTQFLRNHPAPKPN